MAGIVYRVKDWDDHFESRDSRRLKKMQWLKLSTKINGDQYAELLSGHPDGPKHFAAWIGILQVAANCENRGTLIRENRNGPHTPISLAFKTRIPVDWFEGAIPRLISIGWLETVENFDTAENDPKTAGHDSFGGKIPSNLPSTAAQGGKIPANLSSTEVSGGKPLEVLYSTYKERDREGDVEEEEELEATYQSVPVPPEMPPSFPVAPFSPDAGFEALTGISMAAGKKYSEAELLTACRVWVSLPLEDQIAAVRDYRMKVSNGTWSQAQFVPGIESYLRKQSWKAKGPGRILPEVRAMTRGDMAQAEAAEKFLREG